MRERRRKGFGAAGSPAGEVAEILAAARRDAAQIVADAKARAESIERDARARVADSPLGREYADLQRRINDLRAFEREYRSRLIAYLESSLKDLRPEVSND